MHHIFLSADTKGRIQKALQDIDAALHAFAAELPTAVIAQRAVMNAASDERRGYVDLGSIGPEMVSFPTEKERAALLRPSVIPRVDTGGLLDRGLIKKSAVKNLAGFAALHAAAEKENVFIAVDLASQPHQDGPQQMTAFALIDRPYKKPFSLQAAPATQALKA